MSEILLPIQLEIIKVFAKTRESDYFCLTGGTAFSAFYLYHRISEDLDFFTTDEEIIPYFVDRLKNNLEKTISM